MTESYIRLNPDGSAQYVCVDTNDRDITTDLINLMGSKAARKCPNAFRIKDAICGMIINGAETYCYTRLRSLELRTSFKLYSDKIMRPVFLHSNTPSSAKDENPIFQARWQVPETMHLLFAARIQNPASTNPYSYHSKACYLVAFDDSRRAFQLPLPNLYDGCDLCMGQFEGAGDSCASAFARAYDQLASSSWNTDLFDMDKASACDALFHFKPTKEDILGVVHPAGFDWSKFCKKRATPTLETLSQII